MTNRKENLILYKCNGSEYEALNLHDHPAHILLLFIDGLGIGENNQTRNPCCTPGLRYFNHFKDETYPKRLSPHGFITGLDAVLGLPGLPQSATGQTALLTGINAAQAIGRHLNGFPNQKLRDIIAEHSILKRVTELGKRAAFLNTFRPPFFDYDPFEIIRYLSVTSVCNLSAGLPFFDLDDLRRQHSIYQDISGESLKQMGFDVPIFTPEKGGEIIGRQSQSYHFSLFEYFQTDRAGHSRDYARAADQLLRLERFLQAVLEHVDLKRTLVIVTSDHGNIEDLTVKGHTRNPAMTLVFGRGSEIVTDQIHRIEDITPVLVQLLQQQAESL